MRANTVANIETVELDLDGELMIGIMLAISVQDLSTLDVFMSEVVEIFKTQRMGSPPETQALLVTMIGDLTAEQFSDRWIEMATTDEVLSNFMAQMSIADVVHGTADGQMLDNVSLLGVA